MLPAQKWRSSQLISSKSHLSLSACKYASGSDTNISVLYLMKFLSDSPRSCWYPETLMMIWFPSPSPPISSCSVPHLSQVELHTLQLVTDREGNTPSWSHLPIPPEEPASFHSNTPPCLCDANKVNTLQVCTQLSSSCLFSALVRCKPEGKTRR